MEILRYWSRHNPIPAGWELVNDMAGTHHGYYGVLIRKVD